jgi:hypothetical protein
MTDPLDTMLDSLRTDVPEMSDQAFAAGRARVQAVDDPITVATTSEPDAVVVELPKQQALRSPPRRALRLVASAAAVVALATGLVAIQSDRGQEPVVVSSAEALNAAAENTTATEPPVGPGQYRYTATRVSMVGGTESLTWMSESLDELWVPQDMAQEWLLRRSSTPGTTEWIRGSAEEAAANGIDVDEPQSHDFRGPCGDYGADDEGRAPCTAEPTWYMPSPEFFDEMPRDPAALLVRLGEPVQGAIPVGDEHNGKPATVIDSAIVGLGTGLVPTDLRAAIYRAIALMPEVEITEGVANLDGRIGTAFGVTKDGRRQELIVDTTTGEFLGERLIATEADGDTPAGRVYRQTAMTTAVADEIGVPPAG